MKIEFNTGHNISGGDKLSAPLIALITEKLSRFSSHLTRVEVHISDQDGNKDGRNDIKCMIEARPRGLKPIAVTHRANTPEQAVEGSIEKLKTSLDTVFGRLSNQ
ncbi:MAG: HPF/RaiA family ribosome-associated protein [Bacteroidota bacterium]